MLKCTSPDLRAIVKKAHPGDNAVAKLVDDIDFLEFGNLEESVKDDVKYLQENPLVVEETKITGWIYHVETGKVRLHCFLPVSGKRILLRFQATQIL